MQEKDATQTTDTAIGTATHATRHIVATYLLIALIALLPRVLNLGTFVTHDEAEFWLYRSELFLEALQTGTMQDTAISTHPGVTTMWLGVVGIHLRHLLRAWNIVQEVPFPLLLALMRLPVAIAHTIGLLLSYTLLRRLLPLGTATLAALLWATDPFIIGYSRLLHVDALTGTFATLSLLAACYHWNEKQPVSAISRTPMWQRWGWLIVSGVSAALAMLSKSPGFALVPVIGGLAVVKAAQSREWKQHIASMLIWSLACVVTIALLWPASWAAPVHMYNLIKTGIQAEGANPHMTGNFFLGAEDPAPGLLFYPVAMALRMTPWAMVGLLLLPFAMHKRFQGNHGDTQRDNHTVTATLALLAGFVLVFTIGLSMFPKKFDRYVVPAFPSLTILAAVGIAWASTKLPRLAHGAPRLAHGAPLIRYIIVLIAMVNVAWWHPYNISYFNQALGGIQKGARTFQLGWGEGYDQVAAWLNAQPDITGVVTAAVMTKTLNPYLRHGAQATTPSIPLLPQKTGYVVVYIYQAQGTVFPPFDEFYGQTKPLHTVSIHGVDYAWIYQVPPSMEYKRPATFSVDETPTFHLRGFSREGKLQAGQTLHYQLHWEIRNRPDTNYWIFAHVVDENQQRYAQVDRAFPTENLESNRFMTTEIPITIPEDAPAGTYKLVIGVYDPTNEQRLPLTTRDSLRAAPDIAGDHALLVEVVPVRSR